MLTIQEITTALIGMMSPLPDCTFELPEKLFKKYQSLCSAVRNSYLIGL